GRSAAGGAAGPGGALPGRDGAREPELRMDEERARPGAGPPGTDRGSAVVEYVMVAGLVAMIFAATLQLALALHVRNTLIDAAAAGARYGTLADRSPEDGVERTRRIVSGALGPRYAQDVVATTAAVG